jgi:endonuclease/exonuclease/phosphatase family metal-dependent hydrolase
VTQLRKVHRVLMSNKSGGASRLHATPKITGAPPNPPARGGPSSQSSKSGGLLPNATSKPTGGPAPKPPAFQSSKSGGAPPNANSITTAVAGVALPIPPARLSPEDVYAAIRTQVEYYFGDENYRHDTYLRGLEQGGGWIDIKDLLGFAKLRHLATSVVKVVRSFQALLPERSRVVELDAKLPRVRRLPLEGRMSDYILQRLSHKSFSRDLELQLLAERHAGWVPLSAILGSAKAVAILRKFDMDSPAMAKAAETRVVAHARAQSEFTVSGDGRSVRLCSLATLVQRQIEHYFSDSNLQTDRLMQEQTAASTEGFIALEDIMSFQRLRSMLLPETPIECVSDALRSSTVLELSRDARAVRRRDHSQLSALALAPTAAASTPAVQQRPGQPSWQPQPVASTYDFLPRPLRAVSAHASAFSVLQFNVLADFLARTAQHTYCDRRYVKWEYRRQLLVDGVKRALPDLLCLQEVQGKPGAAAADSHLSQLIEQLRPLGYQAASYALRMDRDGRPHKDLSLGNAVIFNAHVFEPADPPPGESEYRGRVSLGQLVRTQCERLALAKSEQRRAAQHYAPAWATQAAAWARLRHKQSRRTVLVVSCHIACCFETPEVQVAQVSALLEFVRRLAARGDDVVLSGDFNSKPESGVYQLCTEGCLPADHVDANATPDGSSAQPAPQLCDPNVGFLSGLDLQSAYYQCDRTEPALTNKLPSFEGSFCVLLACRCRAPQLVL